ncbi:hypothetical protein [Glycomyces artemisiae]|uniref:PPE family protein n=1 Tax=Glycomyces artemisiae TaxID=1076443 RepID=A0A2T0USE3_9ACTN|nr:hypothetical protein [Glycomyces artemisiae]PRY60859.1 hypothetical protein B0I28_102471 [Glycomyces artemisiae]
MAEEFETEEYGDAQEGIANSAIQARINELMKTPTCGLSECTAKTVDPAEEAWLKLMSAVPNGDGATANIRPSREIQSYALPNGESIASLVASLRPADPDNYAITKISSLWVTLCGSLSDIPVELKNGLTTLAEEWQGDDYDAFEEQVEKVIKNCQKVLGDIWGEDTSLGGAVKNLNDKASEILAQQGGDECPYPSPKFHLEDAAACSHKIHIRPPYFPECEVFPDDETKVAMEWAGFDSTIVDEVQEERERTYNAYIEYTNQYPDYEEDGMRGEELARTRADEYAKDATDSLGTDGQEELQAQATQVNEDITDRTSNTNMAVTEIKPEAGQSEPTTFNDGNTEPPGGLDGGSPPGGGTPPGLGDMKPPGGMKPVSPSTPDMPGNPDNPDLPGSPDLPGGNDPGGLDDNPWEPSTPDPDDLPSGGLAGGGGGGLGGGGLPGGGAGGGLPGGGAGGGLGGGVGGGIGAGGMGGMMGAGGAGRGAGGAGAGGRRPGGMGGKMGAGAGGRGMAGGMMGAGGGRGMGGPGDENGESGTWLTEDDDVWGIGNEKDDPYA